MRTTMLAILLMSSVLAGCTSNTQDELGLTLVVQYEKTNGTIVESHVDGELVSTTNVLLEFDFSNSRSGEELVTFGVDLMDGSSPITINPNDESAITIEFTNHGIYEIIAYAIDEKNQQESIAITIRIELIIQWSESNTYNPKPLSFNPIPDNGGAWPSSILIDSTVENPVLIENIGGGREVDFNWGLFDQQEEACQSRNGRVNEGDFVNWKTIHFNTFEIHELRINYDDGQDYINIEQSVSIQYNNNESIPNA